MAQRPPPSLFEGVEPEIIGIPPEFDGDRANSASFLTKFDGFIRLNRNTQIARDPFTRAAFLVYIMMNEPHTITVKWWARRNSEWLSQVENNPDVLPRGLNTWEVLEADFKETFKDLFGPEMAANKLQTLRMKEFRGEEYIAEFENLARRAGFGEPYTIRLFVRGLPPEFAEACIADANPKSFDQWTSAVRNRLLLCQRVLRAIVTNKLRENRQTPNRGASVRGRNEQDIPSGRPRTTTPRDSNPNRNAINEAQYSRERRCFRCRVQGHIARHCPN
jgi:hypothetical protein